MMHIGLVLLSECSTIHKFERLSAFLPVFFRIFQSKQHQNVKQAGYSLLPRAHQPPPQLWR
ncbi:MAG: hypothetical protein CMF12_05070 [Idiomarina sp.]|nr:hypothetical protein [Idiomarina sp.]